MEIPPLRDRKKDIPLLVNHFFKKFSEKKGRDIQGISPDAQDLLMAYSWPRNIRELENLMERLITLKQEGVITPSDLPGTFTKSHNPWFLSNFTTPEEGINLSEMILEFEKKILQQALIKSNGVKNRAAQLLHMNRTTLVERLKRRGIPISS